MEGCCSCSWLRLLPSLLLLVQLPPGGSIDEFTVAGPSDPVVAVLGGSAMLPCSLFPPMSAVTMELRWFRTKFSEVVFSFRDQQEQKEEQMAQYAGRTSLVRDFLTQGEAAVRIHSVRVSDDGLYTCFFKKGGFYEEANLELKVAGVGSAPQVHIRGPEEDGVRVVCTASGWFPKPQVQWRDLRGEKLLALSETHAQDPEGLFRVEAALVVRDSSAGNVTCSILNPVLGQERTTAIFIPEPFFPQASLWKPAFVVSLTVLGLLLCGAGCFLKREHSAKLQVQQERKKLRLEKEEAQQAKEEAPKSSDELQAALRERKAAYLAAWRKAQLYGDWRKEQFQAWAVTLDPRSAHPDLAVSHERTRVTWKDTCEDSSTVFSVLGLEGITSGRCYWEVEIRDTDSTEWALGVCRGDAKKTGWYREIPDRGFWAVGRADNRYCACTQQVSWLSLRRPPHRVGVFLDYSEGDLSFYNMTDGSHIFSFPPASFSGTLFPYFRLKSGDVSMTIRSTVGGPEESSVPLSNSSSLEPLKPPGELTPLLSTDSGLNCHHSPDILRLGCPQDPTPVPEPSLLLLRSQTPVGRASEVSPDDPAALTPSLDAASWGVGVRMSGHACAQEAEEAAHGPVPVGCAAEMLCSEGRDTREAPV